MRTHLGVMEESWKRVWEKKRILLQVSGILTSEGSWENIICYTRKESVKNFTCKPDFYTCESPVKISANQQGVMKRQLREQACLLFFYH